VEKRYLRFSTGSFEQGAVLPAVKYAHPLIQILQGVFVAK
jgi:hypothetical protein